MKKILVLFLFCLMVIPAHATVLVLPTDDAYTDSANPNTNYGNATLLHLKKTDTHVQKVLLRFDLTNYSSILQTNVINQIILGLKPFRINHAGSILIKLSDTDFSESTVTHSNAPFASSPVMAKIPVTPPSGPLPVGSQLLVPDPILIDMTRMLLTTVASGSSGAIRYVLELTASDGLDMVLRGKDLDGAIDSFSTGLELKPVSDGSFSNTPKIIANETKNIAQDISITANATKNGFQDVSILANNSSLNTNAGNISLNAGEISTNTNKNIEQDTAIANNTTNNTSQSTAILNLNALTSQHGTKHREYDTTNTNQQNLIEANKTIITNNHNSITAIKTKNTAQDTAIANIQLTPGPQGIQGQRGIAGTNGVKGDQGTSGNDGIQGIQGAKGNAGIRGATGPSGSTNLKKWANINGRPATPTKRASHGIGSVTRSGHIYTINFSPAFPNANYVMTSSTSNGHCFIRTQLRTKTVIYCLNTSGQATVADFINVAFFQ